ncbi:hypothetical protein SETIT_9G324800v2 [Setaria italica]|uniref:Non-haem dioxygenase N-terminal domain-containing protein n=1 Tax=Setaria italica TaxID=4555 RepID=A0A368SN10_SETIT|nr:hypothetical protein SETIT_9G324800v2 [Setaria italica]
MAHAEVGRSIPVPNVQALAQTCSGSDEQIPERYIRVEEAAEEVISGRDISSAIPIIDLNKLLDPQSSKEECAKLGSACNQWGFFQLINHGVPDEVIHNFRNGMAEFFKQSLEAKKMYSQVPAVLKGMILSNGRYKSVEHRAIVHSTKERMSAAVFHQPCQDSTVAPLPELVKNDGRAQYSSISFMDFIKGYFAAKLDGRSYLESLKS